jgi:hypothetical protein
METLGLVAHDRHISVLEGQQVVAQTAETQQLQLSQPAEPQAQIRANPQTGQLRWETVLLDQVFTSHVSALFTGTRYLVEVGKNWSVLPTVPLDQDHIFLPEADIREVVILWRRLIRSNPVSINANVGQLSFQVVNVLEVMAAQDLAQPQDYTVTPLQTSSPLTINDNDSASGTYTLTFNPPLPALQPLALLATFSGTSDGNPFRATMSVFMRYQ